MKFLSVCVKCEKFHVHLQSKYLKIRQCTEQFLFLPKQTVALSEYINVIKRKLKLPKKEIMDVCLQNIELCMLQPVTLPL